MSHFRLARLTLILAALGLNAAPALVTSAHAAQAKPDAAAAAKEKEETVRPDLFKLLDPKTFKELMDAKKYSELQEKLAAAEAFPNKTPYESYVVDRMKLSLAVTTQNEKTAMAALESVIASGRLTPQENSEFVTALANYYFNAKNYPKAIELFKRYQKESDTPNKVRGSLIRAYYLSNDFASAKTELLASVADAEKAGKAPDMEDLRILAGSAGKLKDTATYIGAMEKLVQFYPSDDFWGDLLHRMESKPTFNNRWVVDVLRLQEMATSALAPEEYLEMIDLELLAGQMTEAKQIVDKAFAAGVLGTGPSAAKHKQLREKVNKNAADDAKTIGTGEATALKAKDGTGLVNLGYAYVTMGQADKGLGLIEQGIAKGGFKRPDEVKLHQAIALTKAGKKDEARKVFESLKGDDGLTDLAKYWVYYLNRPTAK
jgi:tetratricopeptide (TPR) repeat protein